MSTTWVFTSSGSSSLDFLRVGWGTTQITAGTWTLTNATTGGRDRGVHRREHLRAIRFLHLSGGGALSTAGNMSFGDIANSTGNGLITGSGTTITATGANTGQLTVGNSGTGSLTISGGAVVNTRLGDIGATLGRSGRSSWTGRIEVVNHEHADGRR